MKDFYTSGELAKRCNVSVRTVQYYDREGILHASRDEKGKRLYNEDDVQRLLYVGVCKQFSLSLQEIKKILDADAKENPLEGCLRKQHQKNIEQIELLKIKNDRIQILLVNMKKRHEDLDITELESLLETKHIRDSRKTNIFLCVFILLEFICFPLWFMYIGEPYVLLILLIILLCALIWFHASHHAYQCEMCKQRFKLSFYKDLFSWNGGKKGKYTICPYCGHKGWFKETHI